MNKIKIDIINLEHRTDRKEQVLKSLKQIEDVRIDETNFFKAHRDDINGALGCAISHFSILADFIKNTQFDYQIVFEDDVEFKRKIKIHDLLQSITGKFDCFLFAHNTAIATNNIDGKFSRVINAQTASGYIITRAFAPVLLNKFGESINNLLKYRNPDQKDVVNSLFAIDVLWKQLQINYNFLTTFPSMAFQRQSYSDIEKKDVNYGV